MGIRQVSSAMHSLNWRHNKVSPLYPPLNALVVSKATNLPSVGADPYLARFLGISQAEIKGPRRREHVAAVQKKIFSYPHWDTVLQALAAAPQPRG